MSKFCANCGVEGTKMPKCAECQVACYCGRGCQKQHWKVHKYICKSAQKLKSGGKGRDDTEETTFALCHQELVSLLSDEQYDKKFTVIRFLGEKGGDNELAVVKRVKIGLRCNIQAMNERLALFPGVYAFFTELHKQELGFDILQEFQEEATLKEKLKAQVAFWARYIEAEDSTKQVMARCFHQSTLAKLSHSEESVVTE
jgi:hypothetical protein